MDAIHIMLGQNGRPGRPGAVPQPASADIAAAFSQALAALEGKHADEASGDADAPEEDEPPAEEVNVEVVPAEKPEVELAIPSDTLEEEVLPLMVGNAPARAMPEGEVREGEIATANTAARAATPASHPFAQTVVSAQGPQQETMALHDVPAETLQKAAAAAALDASPEVAIAAELPAKIAAPAETSRSALSAAPVLPRPAVATYSDGASEEIPAAGGRETTSESDIAYPEGEAADVRSAGKAAVLERPVPQVMQGVTFDTTAIPAIDAKADEGGTRVLTEAIGPVATDAGLSQSRAPGAGAIAPAVEARPVLHLIAEATVKAQDGTIELRLSPEELGRVRISMSHHDLGISVILNVERDDTLALLRRHASELAAALRDAGLGEATVEFADRDQHPSQDSQRRAPGRAFGVLSDAGTELERTALRLSGDGALDIRM